MDSSDRKRRLFAGVALDDEARAACAEVAGKLRRGGFEARYEAPEKLHVTLAFLGNVSALSCGAVAAALLEPAARNSAFTVTLDKLGAFPHERKPRVVYAGAREQGSPFRDLMESVQSAYRELGFSFKEDPVAHVTLARIKDPRRPLPLVEFQPIVLRIEAISLFESIFDPRNKTSRYEVVDAVKLKT